MVVHNKNADQQDKLIPTEVEVLEGNVMGTPGKSKYFNRMNGCHVVMTKPILDIRKYTLKIRSIQLPNIWRRIIVIIVTSYGKKYIKKMHC